MTNGAVFQDRFYICYPLLSFLACISAIVELLLSHNPRIDSLTALGDTPLHGAMYGNRPEIVKMILDAGEIAIECSRKH